MLNWLCRYAPAARLLLDDDGRLADSLLDVGCGPHGFACIAPDAPFAGVDVAFPQPVAPSMTAVKAAPGRLPFPDAAFGTVLCLDVLEHVPRADRAGFVRELARVAARRVVLACPSSECAPLDDFVRQLFAARGGPAPEWLQEHDEHVLPTPAEIEGFVGDCPGFAPVPLPMPNGILSWVAVLGDFVGPLTGAAAADTAARPADWARVFQAGDFGSSWRKGWVLERTEARLPLVDPARLPGDVLAALRCAGCDAALAAHEPGLLRCAGCGRLVPRDATGAWDLDATPFEGLEADRGPTFVCEPSWSELPLHGVMRAFAEQAPAGAVLVLRAAPQDVSGAGALERTRAALGGRPLPPGAEVIVVDEPLDAAGRAALRAAGAVVDERAPAFAAPATAGR